jgi:glutaredoxin
MHAPISADHAAGSSTGLVSRWHLAWVCGCLVLSAGQLPAQTVYRIVGPDGQVTFSDKPSFSPANKVSPVGNVVATVTPPNAALPFELRQVVAKYPVTLYTGNNCAPCDSGRSLLASRGVPFSEKTIGSMQDAEALQKLSGSNSLPFLTIGAQHVAGFSDSEWTQYLSAAGYPERSRLPADYRAAQPTPLTTPAEKASAPSPAASADTPAAPVLPSVGEIRISPARPAGIQF